MLYNLLLLLPLVADALASLVRVLGGSVAVGGGAGLDVHFAALGLVVPRTSATLVEDARLYFARRILAAVACALLILGNVLTRIARTTGGDNTVARHNV